MKRIILISLILVNNIIYAGIVDTALGTIKKYEKKAIDTSSKIIYPLYKSGEGLIKLKYNTDIQPYTYKVERYFHIKTPVDLKNRINYDLKEGYYFIKRELNNSPIYHKIKNDIIKIPYKLKNIKVK